MVKKFSLTVPKSKRKDYTLENLNPNSVSVAGRSVYIASDLEYRALFPVYEPIPIKQMWDDLVLRYSDNPPIQHYQYVDHRQMDSGRAIALNKHPRRKFVDVDNNVWHFVQYVPFKAPNPYYDPNWGSLPYGERSRARFENVISYEIKDYYVTWDGALPFPDSSASTSSFTGRDSYMWAVYFLNNDIPDDSLWFPVPNKYPEWNSFNVGEFVPDYNLSI